MMRRHIARACIVIGAMFAGSCAEESDSSRPSILPELAELEPMIACIDATPRDVPNALEECVEDAGISLGNSAEPKTVEDFLPAVLSGWLLLDRDTGQLTPESFARALDYAACVEAAAYADERFSSLTSAGVTEVRWRAEEACKGHPLSIRALNPDDALAAPDIAERLFARLLGNIAMTYALEANGWFPDEMRPCIHYVDGRPPSRGCALNPQPRSAPRPPPPAPR